MQLRRQRAARHCRRDSWRPPAAAGRSAARAAPEAPRALLVQNASWRAIALSGSLSSPKHLVLPQRVVGILHRQRRKLRRAAAAARRVGATKIARQRAPATSRRRRCDAAPAAAHARSRRAQTDGPAAAARWQDRSPEPCRRGDKLAKPASRRALRPRAAAAPPRLRGSAGRGTPSVSGKTVRKALVPRDHIAQRRFQRRLVERARSAATANGML